MTFLVGDEWIDAPAGSFVLAPGGTVHDFRNRTDRRAGALNISVPGAFETRMPDIVDWFRRHPPGDPRIDVDGAPGTSDDRGGVPTTP